MESKVVKSKVVSLVKLLEDDFHEQSCKSMEYFIVEE